MGLNIGDRIEVIDIEPTVGTIVVRKDGTDISLKREFAKKIYVE
jgi:Fe2+ transport system protein FeoA